MKTWITLIILFFTSILIVSCEGYSCADGTVLDKSTNMPLDSVYVKVQTGSQTIYTDSSGKFEVCNKFGGCVPKCKDIIVEFSKEGYLSQVLTNPTPGLNVYLEK